ncbi:MAG: sterol desaturase family protein [Armatimonadetes bacterium]|nr:sterol desaturase family protein [Armatimonadota bacterium]MDE2207478.1 sterol desaturase family protein [Armatimonadota bacterium]
MTWEFRCQVLAFLFYFTYASFFEWAFHKHLFHSPKFIRHTFKAHALVHHQRYRYEPASYEWVEGRQKDHISMDWFALPMFIGVHLPFMMFAQWFTGIPSLWGGLAAVTAYYGVYEYFHYCMHVPRSRWFERTAIYRFVKEHHRIHHRYMQQNFNVFFPLADVCLGTFRSRRSVPVSKCSSLTAPSLPAEPTHHPARPVSTAPEPAIGE